MSIFWWNDSAVMFDQRSTLIKTIISTDSSPLKFKWNSCNNTGFITNMISSNIFPIKAWNEELLSPDWVTTAIQQMINHFGQQTFIELFADAISAIFSNKKWLFRFIHVANLTLATVTALWRLDSWTIVHIHTPIHYQTLSDGLC